MTRINTLLGLLPMILVGCVSATVEEPSVCGSDSLGTIPASPVGGVTLPPQTFSSKFDFSEAISKLQGVSSDLSVNVNALTLDNSNGDLAWVSAVDVSVTGNTSDTPEVSFASYHGTNPGTSVSIPILMDDATILRYLSHPVTLTFTINGTAPTKAVNFSNTMCVAATGQFNKAL
jgi:hypothetical protein